MCLLVILSLNKSWCLGLKRCCKAFSRYLGTEHGSMTVTEEDGVAISLKEYALYCFISLTKYAYDWSVSRMHDILPILTELKLSRHFDVSPQYDISGIKLNNTISVLRIKLMFVKITQPDVTIIPIKQETTRKSRFHMISPNIHD
jgi:hypothetical protein